MFPNLEAELARRKITKCSLAKKISKTPTTLCLKLKGKAPITLRECLEIKEAINTDLSIEYLFSVEQEEK